MAGVRSSASRRFSPNFSLRCSASSLLKPVAWQMKLIYGHQRNILPNSSNPHKIWIMFKKRNNWQTQKDQIKHPSDHLLKFLLGKRCISQSATLDPPSIWTSSHSPGTARVGPHPPEPLERLRELIGQQLWHLFICVSTVT